MVEQAESGLRLLVADRSLPCCELHRQFDFIGNFDAPEETVGLIDVLATRTVVIGTFAVEPADVTDVDIGSFLTAFRIMIR